MDLEIPSKAMSMKVLPNVKACLMIWRVSYIITKFRDKEDTIKVLYSLEPASHTMMGDQLSIITKSDT